MLSFLYSLTLTSIHDYWTAKARGYLGGARGYKCRCNITGVRAEIWSRWKRVNFYAYIVFSSLVSVIITQNYTQFYILRACEHAQSCLESFAQQAPLSVGFCFSGKNARVASHFLLQGIFLPQGFNCVSCLSSTGRGILYHWGNWFTTSR